MRIFFSELLARLLARIVSFGIMIAVVGVLANEQGRAKVMGFISGQSAGSAEGAASGSEAINAFMIRSMASNLLQKPDEQPAKLVEKPQRRVAKRVPRDKRNAKARISRREQTCRLMGRKDGRYVRTSEMTCSLAQTLLEKPEFAAHSLMPVRKFEYIYYSPTDRSVLKGVFEPDEAEWNRLMVGDTIEIKINSKDPRKSRPI